MTQLRNFPSLPSWNIFLPLVWNACDSSCSILRFDSKGHQQRSGYRKYLLNSNCQKAVFRLQSWPLMKSFISELHRLTIVTHRTRSRFLNSFLLCFLCFLCCHRTLQLLNSLLFYQNNINDIDQYKNITIDLGNKHPSLQQNAGKRRGSSCLYWAVLLMEQQVWNLFICKCPASMESVHQLMWKLFSIHFFSYWTAIFPYCFTCIVWGTLLNCQKQRPCRWCPPLVPTRTVLWHDCTQFELFRLNAAETVYSSIVSYWGNKPSRQHSLLFHLQPAP